MENREYHRVPVVGMVADVFQPGWHLGQFPVRNISRSGAFIRADCRRVSKGRIVGLHLSFEDQLVRQAVTLRAQVVHCSNDGVGIAFSQKRDDDCMLDLGRLLARHLAENWDITGAGLAV